MTDEATKGSLLYYLNETVDWLVEQNEANVKSPGQPNLHPSKGRISGAVEKLAVWWTRRSNILSIFNEMKSRNYAWHFAFSPNHAFLLILKDTHAELRGARREKDFDTVLMQLRLEPDPYPQWRQIVWSNDSFYFGVGSSAGGVSVFDVRGSLVCTVAPPGEMGDPLACCFLEVDFGGSGEVVCVCVHVGGLLRIVDVSQPATPRTTASVDLTERIGCPILCGDYCHSSGVLVIGTLAQGGGHKHSDSMAHGLIYWRRLNEHPYLKPTMMSEDDLIALQHLRLWNQFLGTSSSDGVCSVRISMGNRRLAAAHCHGGITVWSFPGAKLLTVISPQQQLFHDLSNPVLKERIFHGSQRIFPCVPSNRPVSVQWWSDEDVIILRQNGCLSITSVADLKSRTGDNPEWFEPFSRICGASDGSFFVLECETRRKRKAAEGNAMDKESEDEDEDLSLGWRALRTSGHYIKTVFAIDADEPLRKKPKLVQQMFRMICFKSTTPEELFQRKIVDEEYGEALALALKYGLDTDIIYQKQWQKSRMTKTAIEDFLTKISKRNWILHECLERVPEDLDSIRSLLEFGLQATDVDALLAAGTGDSGTLVLTTANKWLHNLPSSTGSTPLTTEEERELMRKCEQDYRLSILKKIDRSSFTLMQEELLRIRRKLLNLMDKLDAYEEVLGGRHRAPDRFKSEDFINFREISPIEAAVKFAREGNYDAIAILFTRFACQLNDHRLAVIGNISETNSPKDYASLLPELGKRLDEPEVFPLQQTHVRDLDWCETKPVVDWFVYEVDDGDVVQYLYEDSDYINFRTPSLSRELLTEWYSLRAREIESRSKQTSCALQLAIIGMERGVEGLEDLYHDFVQLDMLIYDCRVKGNLTLQGYWKMSDMEKVRLMMSNTSEEMFIKHVCKWLLPFLDNVEKTSSGKGRHLLREYLLYIGNTNLSFIEQILYHRNANSISHPFIQDSFFVAQLCADLLSDNEAVDQLKHTAKILQLVPRQFKAKQSSDRLAMEDRLSSLDKILSTLKTLGKYGVKKSFKYVIEHKDNPEVIHRLMVEIVHRELKKSSTVNKSALRTMLNDLQASVSEVFRSIHPKMLYKIVVDGMLQSNDDGKIHMAKEFMELDRKIRPMTSSRSGDLDFVLNFDESVDCVVNAAREYFISAIDSKDSAFQLSRICLSLIQSKSPEIQKEMKQIDGLVFLESAGLKILPVEFRTNHNRSSLLLSCLRLKPNLYQKIDKVMDAAVCLQIGPDDETCKGEALRYIVQSAFNADDFKTALTAARSLVKRKHVSGWEECLKVSQHRSCPNDAVRSELLHFVISHCPDTVLSDNLALTFKAESDQILMKCFPPKDSEADTKSFFQPGLTALSTVIQKSTQTLSKLTALSSAGYDDSQNKPDGTNMILSAFYDTGEGTDLISSCKRSMEVDAGADVLRAIRLKQSAETGVEIEESFGDIYSKLCVNSLKSDSVLALTYSLHVTLLRDLDPAFASLTPSCFNHALSLYAICLRIILQSQGCISFNEFKCGLVFKTKEVLAASDAEERELFERYLSTFEDYVQAKKLQEINDSVDLTRFTNEPKYKEETILGLCMTDDEELFQFALTLAKRYQVDEWEAYMTFFEYLLCESDMSVGEIESTLSENDVLGWVSDDKERFVERMNTVYSILDGRDYAKLQFFFSLTNAADTLIAGLPVTTHTTVLKKIKSAAPNIDYKRLVSRCENPMPVIAPVLNPGNVYVFGKLASYLCDDAGKALKPSLVFSTWAIRAFREGEKASDRIPETALDWVSRYESCGDYISRMLPVDYVEFIASVVFGKESLQVTIESRLEILRRSLKFCRQQHPNKKKQDDSEEEYKWKDAAEKIKEYSRHLEFVLATVLPKLESYHLPDSVVHDAETGVPGDAYYMDLFAGMIARQVKLSEVMEFAESVDMKDMVDPAFTHALFSMMEASVTDHKDSNIVLTNLASSAADILSVEAITTALKGLLRGNVLRRQLGRTVVDLIQSKISKEELRNHVVEEIKEICATEFDLSEDETCDLATLVGSLVEKASSDESKLIMVGDALQFAHLIEPLDKIWKNWMIACIRYGRPRLIPDRYKMTAASCLPANYFSMAFDHLAGRVPALAISFALLSDPEGGVARVLLLLDTVDDMEDVDEEAIRTVVQRHFVPKFVNTPLYQRLVKWLLEENDPDLLLATAQDLRTAGFVTESSNLLAEHNQMHPSSGTLGMLRGLWGRFAPR